MHPPLHRPHPDCQQFVENLERCHDERSIAKFVGACNQAKTDLDNCFRQEKVRMRKQNFENAKKSQANFQKFVEEQNKNKAASS
jgi:COX assembly mitochondrial protein 2